MSNRIRQYIGARYVTKIYENSLDPSSAEWESGINWEPLIVVTYNNGSYMSKKFIPASIGNPADNPEYWTQTGFYNGQIAILQQQVADILADLQTVVHEDDLIVCVTDSYGNRPNNWIKFFGQYMGIDVANLIGLVAPGYGFNSGRFQEVITPNGGPYSISNTVDPDRVTKIIVCGGFNDMNIDASTAIGNFMTYAKSQYPNAHVYIGFIGWSFNDHYLAGFAQHIGLRAYSQCEQFGATYLNGVQHIMKNKALFAKENPFPVPDVTEQYNYIHPNDDGEAMLGRFIANAINNGNCTIEYPRVACYFEGASIDITPTTNFFWERLSEDEVYLEVPVSILFNHSTTYTVASGNTTIDLGVMIDGDQYANPANPYKIPMPIYIVGGTLGNRVVPGNMILSGNKISVQLNVDIGGTCTSIGFFAGSYRVSLKN